MKALEDAGDVEEAYELMLMCSLYMSKELVVISCTTLFCFHFACTDRVNE